MRGRNFVRSVLLLWDLRLPHSSWRDGTPPTVGPGGRAGHPSSPAALGHGGGVWGSQQALPRLLCQCLTSWSDTPSLVPPSPKGDHGLHFHLPPPKWGTAGQVHHSWAPTRKEGRATAVRISLDGVGGFWLGEGGVSAWGGVPCGHVGDLPSAKRFPLSRSKNTKLGTPGAPQPRLPGPIPTPTPGWLSWVGGLGGGIPSHPIHLSPSRPPPCLALGKTFPTKTPHPLAWAKAIALGWASASSAPSLALLALSRYPRPGQPPPTSPETGLSSQTSPRGLANSTIRERPFPTNPPSHCPEAFKNPWSVRLSPGPPPLGGCWGPKHGPLSGRAGGGGSCSWGIRKLLSREP
ncbi:WAS/WASL-interacting protein family member 1-like [Neomonachus schauinslandi]|uniref:WAS/WASL-interacting protein family member 1-like n=1 Tax=Neomonachus schauinslandi TaxID=29088 RepID=A0A8M1M5B5_NEOSC|nr:WAS/WASL-interacting protein family member 1-like [Neomonachus schauinslandi]